MNTLKRRAIYFVFILIALLALSTPALGAGATYIIPIHGDIDNGNWLFIQRAYDEALKNGASAIIFDIDTYGGYIDSAINIADLILACPLPTYCYVNNKGLSAGSLIALAGETLLMAPGATIGAAEPRLFNQTADPKTISMWAGKLTSIAEIRGRNGQIAAAFADADIEIEGLTEKGKLVTLTAAQTIEYEMADNICANRSELIDEYDLSLNVETMEKNFQEKTGGWLSDPWISAILLTLGIAGIVIEILSAGSFGIFGTVGLISFALYFIGHFWVGNIGVGAILLFLVGLVLIILEIFVIPGFGVTGIMGIFSVLTSLVMAAANFNQAVLVLCGSFLAAVLIIFFTLRNKKTRKVWGKLVLSQKLDTTEGYVSNDEGLTAFLGKRGTALTILRPAGAAEIEGKRVDVVTAGEFIAAGSGVEVTLVEGMRVVVREI
ncbi:MAG: nodulation protein NfeD [Firmicutes bacterium]|nr:nodulation protein NfeD [Bacillota bacterium]